MSPLYSKRFLKHLSKNKGWLAEGIKYSRKGVEHELLIALVELLFQERSLRRYESVPKWISRSSDSYIRTVPPAHT